MTIIRMGPEARAAARSRKRQSRIVKVPGIPGLYRTKSMAHATDGHMLTYRAGDVGCSCTRFGSHWTCIHADALLARIAQEQARSRVRTRRALTAATRKGWAPQVRIAWSRNLATRALDRLALGSPLLDAAKGD